MRTGLQLLVCLTILGGYGCAFSSDPAKSVWRTSDQKWETYSLKGMGISIEAPAGSLDSKSSTGTVFRLHYFMPGPLDFQDAIYMITVEVTKVPLEEYHRRLNLVSLDKWKKWRFSEHRMLSCFETTDKVEPELYLYYEKHVFSGDAVYVFYAESRKWYSETYNYRKTDEAILARMANSLTPLPPSSR